MNKLMGYEYVLKSEKGGLLVIMFPCLCCQSIYSTGSVREQQLITHIGSHIWVCEPFDNNYTRTCLESQSRQTQ